MASDGLLNRAKKGKCRICYRVRCTDKHVKAVGEVRHGFAVGHIWECIDIEDCETVAKRKLSEPTRNPVEKHGIAFALKMGRFKEYIVIV